jgi:hypothetical protein
MVSDAFSTSTRTVDALAIIKAIKIEGRWREEIGRIRRIYDAELKRTDSHEKAKKAVKHLKEALLGVLWSGIFSRRGNEYLLQHSGLFCADLDVDALAGKDLNEVRAKLQTSPYVFADFLSPTGYGLKVIVCVPPDASKHEGSFRAVRQHILDLTGVKIDESGKDPARLCFVSADPDAYLNLDAQEITPRLVVRGDTHKPVNKNVDLGKPTKEQIREMLRFIPKRPKYKPWFTIVAAVGDALPVHEAVDVLNEWSPEEEQGEYAAKLKSGFTEIHIGTLIYLAQQHGWERPQIPYKNASAAQERPDLWKGSVTPPVELPPAPAPYRPPPLTLLPSVLQEYVHAAAESLKRDVSFVFLPKLSAIGTAIGNSRSILLKPGYIQPPNIWTGIINPTGTLKSASIEEARFAVVEHEQELDRLNKEAAEIYAEDLVQWESQKKSLRGKKPKPPEIKTCLMDDLTVEALADRLQSNPRGVLVAKDEISGWFESFDLYRNNKGADVSRWLSIHTGAHFGIDRRTDNRHQRIWQPRANITGGVQPKVFRRLMREDYFERGLPARFIFGAPPPLQLEWTQATIPEKLRQAVRQLFEELWLLQPGHDDHGQPCPKLLRLTEEAREVYIPFYNECGVSALESDEYEAGAWCKLPGYAARFALVGQLVRNAAARDPALRNPEKPIVNGETMQAACDLARWSGNETARIYAELAETPQQREQRELVEFIERRGGAVSVREITQFHRPLRGQRDEAERQLGVLVRNGFGKWFDDKGSRGPAARKFQIHRASTSTGFGKIRGENEKPVDVDSSSSQEITPAEEPKIEPVSDPGTTETAAAAASGASVPSMMTKAMEAQLKQRGLTQAQIDKLTPQRAHEILATPAASVAPPAAPPIVGDEKGVGRL